MGALPVSLACWDYDRTRALADGTVRPEGVDLVYVPLRMPESFFRMRRHGEFDASEMSLGAYVRTVGTERQRLIAIPVFPSRMFRHSCIYVHRDRGISTPSDLPGRRVGVPEYSMTAAVWIKGILAEHHGVPVSSVEYRTGGLLEPGRHEEPLDLPAGIVVEPIAPGRTLSQLLEDGEIDALYSADAPAGFGSAGSNVVRLFADHPAVERAYFERTAIFPIMHTVVLRHDTYQRHRWLAQSLAKAFEEAKQVAYRDLDEIVALKTMLPWLPEHVEETRRLFGSDDFWPYGLGPNHATLATFLRYAHDQGLVPADLRPEDLFAPETVETSKT
jgi:4,5-dihydroxyphthalate decarboxylase